MYHKIDLKLQVSKKFNFFRTLDKIRLFFAANVKWGKVRKSIWPIVHYN